MAFSKNRPDDPKKTTRHEKLQAIIHDRLGLGEEWFAITSRTSFFVGMSTSRLNAFEKALGQAIRLGCKWEVMVACLTRYYTYNARQVVTRHASYDSDGELTRPPEKAWKFETATRPPDSERRSAIVRNLNAAAGEIETHEDLLSTLGRIDPPPATTWVDPRSEGDVRDVHVTADAAVIYVQKLMRWCRKLLSDDSIGNFSTVESVGQLIPCVYVAVVTPKAKPGKQRLALEPVADLLDAISGEERHKQGQLRIALNRFERNYPKVYRELRTKIKTLHETSSEPADGWRQLFAAEDRRRRSR